MTTIHMHVSGYVMKAEHKQAGTKPIVELSFKKKHKGRNGQEDTFTWVRATVWEPADWQAPLLVKGAFVSVHGDVQLRSYVAKDGSKGASLELRAGSFDVEVHDPREAGAAAGAPAQQMAASAAPAASPGKYVPPPLDDEPPF